MKRQSPDMQCENLDGQCGASWCNCDEVRKAKAGSARTCKIKRISKDTYILKSYMSADRIGIPDTCINCGKVHEPGNCDELFNYEEQRDKIVQRLSQALVRIIEWNRQTAQDKYGDPEKAESWACVVEARAALREAKP